MVERWWGDGGGSGGVMKDEWSFRTSKRCLVPLGLPRTRYQVVRPAPPPLPLTTHNHHDHHHHSTLGATSARTHQELNLSLSGCETPLFAHWANQAWVGQAERREHKCRNSAKHDVGF